MAHELLMNYYLWNITWGITCVLYVASQTKRFTSHLRYIRSHLRGVADKNPFMWAKKVCSDNLFQVAATFCTT